MTDWKSSLKAAAVGAAVGTAMGLIAFVFLTSIEHPGMGGVLFLIVPVAAGFSIALVARRPNSTVAAALLAVLVSLACLIAFGREGLLCAILALPIIGAGLGLGVIIGYLVRKIFIDRKSNQSTTTGVLLLIGPLLIFTGGWIERPILEHGRTEVISNTVEVSDSPEHVWIDIQSVDAVQATKPFLMYLGLPIPQRCTMQGQGVGAQRTCYCNTGYIEETVTAWNPPYLLGLSIDRTHMPGCHWLGFQHAEYRLESHGLVTALTRTTTITSYLRPTWYWRRFERLGVESEHRYILQDVVLRAAH